MLLLLRVCAAITKVFVLEGSLSALMLEIVTHLVHCLSWVWMFMCPDIDDNLLSSGIIACGIHGVIHLSCM